jgi:hypothetical protein
MEQDMSNVLIWQAFGDTTPFAPLTGVRHGAVSKYLSSFLTSKGPMRVTEPQITDDNIMPVIQNACENYFNHVVWDETFDPNATTVRVLVVVKAPEKVAGVYAVDLWRIVQANPRKLTETNLLVEFCAVHPLPTVGDTQCLSQ